MQLIVLGMHRSGTSVLARLLNLMGAYFGPEGMSTGANQENPRGFWERRDVRELNDMVLHSVGCDWNRVASLDLDAVPAEVLADFRKRAAHIVLQMDAYRPWMLKEPRLLLLFSLWRDLLHAPVCIQIFRNPVEVASSLHTRNRMPMRVGMALWEFYVRRGIAASEGLPRANVSHRQLIKEPTATVDRLHSQLEGFGVSGLHMPSANEINSFVVDELYREREERSELQAYRKAPQVRLFRELEAGRQPPRPGNGPSKVEMQRLRTYEKQLPPLQPKAKPKTIASQQDPSVAEVVTQLLAELRRREEQLAQVGKRLEQADARVASHAESLSVRAARIAELDSQLAATTTRAEALGAELLERDTSLDAMSSDIAQLKGQLERRNLENQRRQEWIATSNSDLAALRSSLAGTKKALATEKQRRAVAEDSLEFRIEEIVRLTRALMSQEERVSLLSKDLDSANEREAKALEHLAEARATSAEESARAVQFRADLEATVRALIRIRSSRSWRATSLLRSALAWLRPGSAAKVPPPLAARSLLAASGLFDSEWYVAQYPDVSASGMDPLDHYLSFGAAEGRDPSATFDTRAYFARHQSLVGSGINPLVHALLMAAPEKHK